MAHRSPSTLDEETALAVALSISKEETKKSPPSSSATPSRETVGKPDENGSKESAYATAPRDVSSGSNQDSSIHASPSEAPPPSPVVDEPSIPVEAGQPLAPPSTPPGETPVDYPAFAPMNQASLDRFQGAKTRRHILRQNSVHWSKENSIGDKERLLANLALYDLAQKEVKGDGNCQFRAVSDQLYQTPKFHSEVRQQVVKQLKSHAQLYADFADDDYTTYVWNMAKDGTWGDHITLQAAADVFGTRILIVSSYQEECIIEILPHSAQQAARTLFLSFWHEVHYGSIYPSGAPIPEETPKTLGSKHLYRFIHKPAAQTPGVLHI